MAITKTSSLVLFLLLALVLLGALLLARVPAASWELPHAVVPAVQQAARAGALSDLDLDVAGAEGHAVARHGDVARQILDAARAGRCVEVYLECGADRQAPADGTKGYMVCALPGGQLGLVPFYVDALLGRLVAMTAYAIRPGYERYVAQRDGCIPIELLGVFVNAEGGNYADH